MNPLNTPLPAQAKAVLAAIIAGLSALLPLMPDGFQWVDAITALVAANNRNFLCLAFAGTSNREITVYPAPRT